MRNTILLVVYSRPICAPKLMKILLLRMYVTYIQLANNLHSPVKENH